MKNLLVTCEAAQTVDINLLMDLRGKLKYSDPEEREKCKKSLEKFGYTFPSYVYFDGKSYWTIDGHERNKICIEEGYQFEYPDGTISNQGPVVLIHAQNLTEAKVKLLLINTNYTHITEEGIYSFIHDKNLPLIINEELVNIIQIPSISLDIFKDTTILADIELDINPDNYFTPKEININETIKCPKCGYDLGIKKKTRGGDTYDDQNH